MRKFLNVLVLFFSPIIIVGIAIVCSPESFFSVYKVCSDKKRLITGDSHIQYGIIEDTVGQNLKSLALNSEPIYYSYYKLLKLLDHNPQIKEVYLGFSYHSISAYYDDVIYQKEIFVRYFPILPSDISASIVSKNPFVLLGFITAIRNIFENSYLGDFSAKRSIYDAEKMKIRLTSQFYKQGKIRPFSQRNIDYMLKIRSICKERGIKFFCLNAPLHPDYITQIPKIYKDKFWEIIEENDIQILNAEALSLKNSEYLDDGDHTNYKGAVIFSKWFGKELE